MSSLIALVLAGLALPAETVQAQAQPGTFAGVLDVRLSTGARREAREGPCAIDVPAVQQVIMARLAKDGIRATPADEVLQMVRRHMREDERARDAVARDRRLADSLDAERRQRIAIEIEMMGRPMVATDVDSMLVVSADGVPGCAVTVSMRVTGGAPEARVPLRATRREVAASIFLWDSPLHLSFVPANAWTPSVERPVVEVLEGFLRVWRADNPVVAPRR